MAISTNSDRTTQPNDLLCHPVVIIGAGRSGTNMLRDILTKFDNVFTWPCDEINYIWRYGNRDEITDEFEPENVRDKNIDYIRGQFKAISSASIKGCKSTRPHIIEKTCANSLRVGYVNAVVPEAKYIYLVRDGRDVVASAMKRWKASLDVPYLMAKAKYVPKSDLIFYASSYLHSRLAKFRNPEARLSVWGPKFKGWKQTVANNDLPVVCAYQWVRCIEKSESSFAKIPANQVYRLKYEDFVANPESITAELINFLDIVVTQDDIKLACASVSADSVGKGALAKTLSDETIALMTPTLKSLGYSV